MDMSAEVGKIVLASRAVDLGALGGQTAELTAELSRPHSACEVLRLHCGPKVRADIPAVEIEHDWHGENPYAGRPASAFWRRAVAGIPAFALDPMAGRSQKAL
jgi:hypothetical protein